MNQAFSISDNSLLQAITIHPEVNMPLVVFFFLNSIKYSENLYNKIQHLAPVMM